VLCTVVVPSYRSAATIACCLDSLLAQDIRAPFEIVVVDSSDDGTADVVRSQYPSVRLIALASRTDPATARNLGARSSTAHTLAFIDSDCVAQPDWLRRLAAGIDDGFDGIGGAIANANAESAVSQAGYMCEFREFVPKGEARPADNLTLGNAAYRRDAWTATGGFPEGFFPQEDQVFHARFQRAGFRARLDPWIVVRHAHRTVRADFLRHQRSIGRANARVLQEIERPGARLARRPYVALVAVAALVPLRFVRTIRAGLAFDARILRPPVVAWLCWLGSCWWGRGFLEGAWAGRSRA
jgi:glycosyltransferase involved in cell wall biosynthesis